MRGKIISEPLSCYCWALSAWYLLIACANVANILLARGVKIAAAGCGRKPWRLIPPVTDWYAAGNTGVKIDRNPSPGSGWTNRCPPAIGATNG